MMKNEKISTIKFKNLKYNLKLFTRLKKIAHFKLLKKKYKKKKANKLIYKYIHICI